MAHTAAMSPFDPPGSCPPGSPKSQEEEPASPEGLLGRRSRGLSGFSRFQKRRVLGPPQRCPNFPPSLPSGGPWFRRSGPRHRGDPADPLDLRPEGGKARSERSLSLGPLQRPERLGARRRPRPGGGPWSEAGSQGRTGGRGPPSRPSCPCRCGPEPRPRTVFLRTGKSRLREPLTCPRAAPVRKSALQPLQPVPPGHPGSVDGAGRPSGGPLGEESVAGEGSSRILNLD